MVAANHRQRCASEALGTTDESLHSTIVTPLAFFLRRRQQLRDDLSIGGVDVVAVFSESFASQGRRLGVLGIRWAVIPHCTLPTDGAELVVEQEIETEVS